MTPADLAKLRALAERATYVWAQHSHSHYDGHVADYYAAASPDVVLGLLDALETARARVLELEAPGECQSLHKLRAERDELAAEVARLRGLADSCPCGRLAEPRHGKCGRCGLRVAL